MPFKIYTYKDPYFLDQSSFWDEVRTAPHLCVSQTLVNGLRALFDDEFESALMPLDSVLVQLYDSWHRNVGNQISQYTTLSKILFNWKENGKLEEDLYNAFKHNQGELLDALRLLVELNIDSSRLYEDKATEEQRYLIKLYSMAKQGGLSSAFIFPEVTCAEKMKNCIVDALKNEKDSDLSKIRKKAESRKQSKQDASYLMNNLAKNKEEGYNSAIDNLLNAKLEKVVIHGLHQFSPLQLRFIYALHNDGVEVIFLFNYQENFKEIYDTWEYVYSHFDVPIEHDKDADKYRSYQGSHSYALAYSLAYMLNPKLIDYKFFNNNIASTLQNIEFLQFDNVTEFAGYVGNFFELAKENTDGDDNEKIISNMTEQVYSAGSEVHDLLKVYYPEHSGDRHFLSYPIGQFFTGLYKMWDSDSENLIVDKESLKECLAAGLLKSAPSEKLIAIYQNTTQYFEEESTFENFKDRVEKYIEIYKEIYEEPNKLKHKLKQMSVYSTEYVSSADLDCLLNAILELNKIAKVLFVNSSSAEHIGFKEHFKRLEDFIKQRAPDSMILQEEKELIEELLERFRSIEMNLGNENNDDPGGNIDDLKKGLYFYLRQKNVEQADWIVRNFEQIDGDILRSRNQEEDRCYHFACLSDRDMNKKTDNLLPWPLTDYFIVKAYTPIEQNFQVYYAALSEYANFLKYALFYGLCFNKRKVRLSYVRNYGKDDIVQPYFLLNIMGIKPRPYNGYSSDLYDNISCSYDQVAEPGIQYSTNITSKIRTKNEHLIAFALCPYRFFMGYAFKGDMIHNSLFIYSHYFVNLLIHLVWEKKLSGQPVHVELGRLNEHIENEQKLITRYFPFWKMANDFADLKKQAYNFIENQLTKNNSTFSYYNSNYMEIRFKFKKAKYVYVVNDEKHVEHPYDSCKQYYITNDENGKLSREVSLIKINNNASEIKKDINRYLVSNKTYEHPGEWCVFCNQKGKTCLKPFQIDN